MMVPPARSRVHDVKTQKEKIARIHQSIDELKDSLREVGMNGPFTCWVRDSLDGVLILEGTEHDTSQTRQLTWAGDAFMIYVCSEPNQVTYKAAISFLEE